MIFYIINLFIEFAYEFFFINVLFLSPVIMPIIFTLQYFYKERKYIFLFTLISQ